MCISDIKEHCKVKSFNIQLNCTFELKKIIGLLSLTKFKCNGDLLTLKHFLVIKI